MRAVFLHVAMAIGFAALAVVWSWPLVLHLSTHLPGRGLGDNALFLWNFWWMRTARASGTGFWHTSYLFAPAGADLILHTHTALPAWLGATLLRRFPVATALNLTTLGSLALNGFCTYLLAWRIVRQRGAAVLAGIIFGTSPYIAAHLNGHFNLITAWPLPLFALGLSDAMRGSIKWAVLAGIVLAATAYIDYYYVTYEIAFACGVLLLMARQWSVELRARPPYGRWLLVLVGAAIALDLVALVAIGVTGGFSGQLGPFRFSMRNTFNTLQILWVLIAAALWLWFRPRIGAQPRDGWSSGRAARSLAVMLGIFLIAAAPLVWNGAVLLARGQYVTQQYYWRSAPIGIDVVTLFLGNPFHSLWGGALRHLYSRLGIDLIESGAWIGIVPLVLAAYAVRSRSGDPVVRQWAVLGGVFFVWALGSHVHAAGQNTGMIMPEALMRYVPIAANARMPGRAMVVVYLAIAVLAATSVAHIRWRRSALSAMAALVLADFVVAPFPLVSIECPEIYRVVRDRPERGALVELPLGLGDGLGEITPVDHRMFVCQTIHERPLVGGVLARLPTNVLATYSADALIATWLRLSGASASVVPGGEMADAARVRQQMEADGIAFVMLNRRTASPELRAYVEHVMPLTLIAHDEERTLYLSTPLDPRRQTP